MATEYKTIIGLEALEREFEQLAKLARPANAGPGLFSAAIKPAQITPRIFEYTDDAEHAVHALISVYAEKGEPSVRYYDIGEKPKVSSEDVQNMARKFIEACRKSEDWHTYFNDHRQTELRAFAEWTAASVNERPASPPLSKPKASHDDRYAEGIRFVEAVMNEPVLESAPGKVGG